MRDPGYQPAALGQPSPAELLAAVPRAADADPRAFAARVRNELHRLLKALADRNWEAAAAALRTRSGEEPWGAARIAKELEPYFAEHPAIDVTPRARLPHNTLLESWGRPLPARQRIVDPQGEVDWAIACAIELSPPPGEEEPVIELERIGT